MNSLLILFLSFGLTSGIIVPDSVVNKITSQHAPSRDPTIHDLMTLLVGEKRLRVQLEDRLSRELATVKTQYAALLNKYANVKPQTGVVPTRHTVAGLSIGFSVGSPDGNTGYGSNPLRFLIPTFNDRNDFNMNTGEFVCKHSGLYSFTYSFATRYNINYSSCCIMKNGSAASGSSCALAGDATSTRYSSGTVSTLLDLHTGDRVYISECTAPKTIAQSTSFTGFLVGTN